LRNFYLPYYFTLSIFKIYTKYFQSIFTKKNDKIQNIFIAIIRFFLYFFNRFKFSLFSINLVFKTANLALASATSRAHRVTLDPGSTGPGSSPKMLDMMKGEGVRV
jgi:hypothetical protein